MREDTRTRQLREASNPFFSDRKLRLGTFSTNLSGGCAISSIDVAALAVQNAPPDGYTLLVFAGAQHAALPAMQPVAYQPVAGFQPVTILFNLVNFLAVPKDNPANSAAELIELGGRNRGASRSDRPASARLPISTRSGWHARPKRRSSMCSTAALPR